MIFDIKKAKDDIEFQKVATKSSLLFLKQILKGTEEDLEKFINAIEKYQDLIEKR